MPHRESVPALWRLKEARYGVVASRCNKCAKTYFPGVKLCGFCDSACIKTKLSGIGVVESYTKIHVAPPGFTPPYNVAIIKLEEGPKIIGMVVDDKIEIGDCVSVVFRRLNNNTLTNIIKYGSKFRKR